MTRKAIRKRRPVGRKLQNTGIILSIAAALLLVAGALLLNSVLGTPTAAAPIISDGRVWGQPEAPINIELFSDYQCPFCARADAMLHQIAPAYFDSGKAKVTFRHFAFLGDESQWAANAAECAGEQKQFWVFTNFLFTHQAGENAGAFRPINLKHFAGGLNLSATTFNTCVDANKYAGVVQQDTLEGRQRGVRSTPTFFVNGRMVTGLLPTYQFTSMLDSLDTD